MLKTIAQAFLRKPGSNQSGGGLFGQQRTLLGPSKQRGDSAVSGRSASIDAAGTELLRQFERRIEQATKRSEAGVSVSCETEARVQLGVDEAKAWTAAQIDKVLNALEARIDLCEAAAVARVHGIVSARNAASEQAFHHLQTAVTQASSRESDAFREFVSRSVKDGIAELRRQAGGVDRLPQAASARRSDPATAWTPPRRWCVESPGCPGAGEVFAELTAALRQVGHRVVSDPGVADFVLTGGQASVSYGGAGPKTILVVDDATSIDDSGDWLTRATGSLAGVACASRLSQKTLVDVGIPVPTVTVGVGVDVWERHVAEPGYRAPGKAFRFLHVSDCSNVQALDLLLAAYGRVFDGDDDVTLLIKPTGAVPDELSRWMGDFQRTRPNPPHVVLIQEDMQPGSLKALYEQSDVFVSIGRAEGFGIHLAHALLSGLPVVTTAWGGHRDYVDASTGWLVDYVFSSPRLVSETGGRFSIDPLETSIDESLWAAYRATASERFQRAWAGRSLLLAEYAWKNVALRLAGFGAACQPPDALPRLAKLGFVTTWGVRCGIAGYMGHMLADAAPSDYVVFAARQDGRLRPDGRNVFRLWNVGTTTNGLSAFSRYLSVGAVEALVIQFAFGFYNGDELAELVRVAHAANVPVLIEMHATAEPPTGSDLLLADHMDALRSCDRVLVHNVDDLNRMKAVGLVDNVMLSPLGVVRSKQAPDQDRSLASVPLLTSFGFCLPGKGLVELVQAAAVLKRDGFVFRLRMLNALYPHPMSNAEADRIRRTIEELDLQEEVEFRSDYLEDETCFELLGEADLIVNPYQSTGESASAAVRFGLGSGRPVLVTPLPIFDDLGAAVFRMPGLSPVDIAKSIVEVIEELRRGTDRSVVVSRAAEAWLVSHDVSRQRARIFGTARALARLRRAE